MKKAVMYGAGNIGRGFIGKVFSDSGYEVCFIDVDDVLISEMNARGEYGVTIVSDDAKTVETVKNVSAVDARSEEAAVRIAACDIMATAVGVNVMPYIAENIAKAVRLRMAGGPLDIILAENQIDADKVMRKYIYEKLSADEQKWADANLGLVKASIGRMVPPLTPEQRAEDPLQIVVEEYARLPVDSKGFKAGIPGLVGLEPFSPFDFFVKRKLFMHNMSHALCAYKGWPLHYEYIWQAVGDEAIKDAAGEAMDSVIRALIKEFPNADEISLVEHKHDLLKRFANRALKDTVVRVANDPVRKLRANDRLTGAALYCLSVGVAPGRIVDGITAAISYDNPSDPAAMEIQSAMNGKGLGYVMETYMGLKEGGELYALVLRAMRE